MVKKWTNIPSISIIYILVWTIFNLFFLSGFPFMHTDESWLAGLSRMIMLEKNPAATESFFDLVPRAPHAIKILYHYLQIIFIKLFGYSLFSVRLLSLLGGAGSLFVFGSLLKRLSLPPLPGIVLLSLQIQFIYASHFGRQDIFLLFLMLTSIRQLYSNREGFFRGLWAGIPIALAVGFHPNAFIIAWPPALMLLFGIIRKSRKPSEGAGFLVPPAAAAVFFIMLSLHFNNSFVSSYSSFGEEVGVFEAFDVKLLGFDDFYRKLFLRISGTYYTPRIWPVFALSAASAAGLIAGLIITRERTAGKAVITAAAGVTGVNAGILLIGKYSAPSIVYLMPFLIILIITAVESLPKTILRRLFYGLAAAVMLANSFFMTAEEMLQKESFADFTSEIQNTIPPGPGRVLGPLTAEFALKNGRLLDWRNLTALRNAGISLKEYMRSRDIKYIIYTEELDVIFNNRPVWNILYGNPTIYHEQLQSFLDENCSLISEFPSPGYGTRITMHRFRKDWKVMIYQVD